MKKYIVIITISLSTLCWQACKKEVRDIGSPGSKLTGIKATWVLVQAIETDEKSLTKESLDITSFFAASAKKPNITFSDSTFTVDTVGLKVNYFGGTKGNWHFDDPDAPASITIIPTDGPTATLKLGGPIRPQDNLKVKPEVITQCKGDKAPGAIASYSLIFNRVVN